LDKAYIVYKEIKMSESLKLFGTRLLVKEFKKESSNEMKKTPGGIIIPNSNSPQDRLLRGEVIGVGDECVKVKPGDKVIFDKMGPAPFKFEDVSYEMIDESAIIGVYM